MAAEGVGELDSQRVGGQASMGPRPVGRGRPDARFCSNLHFMRQWGRDRLAAEGSFTRAIRNGVDVRQWGRDRLAAEGGARIVNLFPHQASMGPRPVGRGRPYLRDTHFIIQSKRQWGRDRLAAEGLSANHSESVPICRRQWGRDRLAAEGTDQDDLWIGWELASMGPRPVGRGRMLLRDVTESYH